MTGINRVVTLLLIFATCMGLAGLPRTDELTPRGAVWVCASSSFFSAAVCVHYCSVLFFFRGLAMRRILLWGARHVCE